MTRLLIGVLYNKRDLKNILKDKSHEQANFYIKAAQKYNVDVCFFCFNSINFNKRTVLAYFRENYQWHSKRISLPHIIHNRVIYSTKVYDSFKKLSDSGITIYNFWNNYGKFKIHKTININPSLRKYLPPTRLFSKNNLSQFLNYSSFFIKPNRGSVGVGIIKVTSFGANKWKVMQQQKGTKTINIINTNKLYAYLKDIIGSKPYILQKTIPLRTYYNRPFDIRVSTQKNSLGRWQVTGMVGKVAAKNLYLSNVYQGASVATIQQLFATDSINPNQIHSMLTTAALNIVKHLELHLPNLSDVGFDFGIAKNGKPYFIEMNFRDQRYSFALADMHSAFYATYDNPIGYGKFLGSSK
jgi:hypothetical protein